MDDSFGKGDLGHTRVKIKSIKDVGWFITVDVSNCPTKIELFFFFYKPTSVQSSYLDSFTQLG